MYSVYNDNPGHVHDTPDYALFSGDIHQLMANSPDYAFIRPFLLNETADSAIHITCSAPDFSPGPVTIILTGPYRIDWHNTTTSMNVVVLRST